MSIILALAVLITINLIPAYAEGRQLIIREAKGHSPIANALIHDNEGRYITCSDSLGRAIVPISTQAYHISHIAYQSISSTRDTIEMQDYRYPIDAVPVVGKMPEYVRLRTWVRIYQYIDSLPVNYVEGLVDFYTPTGKNKLSYTLRSLALYRDNEAIRREQLAKGAWDINSNGLFDWLLNEHISGQASSDFQLVEGVRNIELHHRGQPYPYAGIKTEDQRYSLSVNLQALSEGKKLKLFGRSVRIVHKELFQVFPQREVELLQPYDMQVYRSFVDLEVDYKGKQLPIRNLTELYVLERKFLNVTDYKAEDRSRHWGNFSHSVAPEEVAKHLLTYPSIPPRLDVIERSLGKRLMLLPPKP